MNIQTPTTPAKDTLVFDVETSNFFTTPDVGWNNFDALKVSAIGVYSYAQDKYFCFGEDEMEAAGDLFRNAGLIVGFSINRYDVPVLNCHFRGLRNGPVNLFETERLDLLDEIERVTGRRVGLGRLAEANLGAGKTSNGAQAIELYKQGKIEELKAYCLKDVELTKGLYELYRDRKYFLIPQKENPEPLKVEFLAPSSPQALPL